MEKPEWNPNLKTGDYKEDEYDLLSYIGYSQYIANKNQYLANKITHKLLQRIFWLLVFLLVVIAIKLL